MRNTVNTFSEAQTFSVNPIMSGARPAADGTAAFRLLKADNTTPVVTVDTTNSRVITAGDVFARNDTAGLFDRLVNSFSSTISTHFNAITEMDSFTWASDATFSGAPSTVDLVYPSVLRVWNSTTSTAHFAFQPVVAGVRNAFGGVYPGFDTTVSFRLDDGTANNSLEIQATQGTSGVFFVTISAQFVLAGSTSTVVLADNVPLAQFASMRLSKSVGGTAVAYFHPFLPAVALHTASGHSWVPARQGFVVRQSPTTAAATHAAFVDWVSIL